MYYAIITWYERDTQAHTIMLVGILLLAFALVKGIVQPPSKKRGGWFDPIMLLASVIIGVGAYMSYG